MYDLELLEIFAPPVLGEDGNANEILEILPPVPVEEPPPSSTSTTDIDTVVEVEIEIEDRNAPDSDSSFDSEL